MKTNSIDKEYEQKKKKKKKKKKINDTQTNIFTDDVQ